MFANCELAKILQLEEVCLWSPDNDATRHSHLPMNIQHVKFGEDSNLKCDLERFPTSLAKNYLTRRAVITGDAQQWIIDQ